MADYSCWWVTDKRRFVASKGDELRASGMALPLCWLPDGPALESMRVDSENSSLPAASAAVVGGGEEAVSVVVGAVEAVESPPAPVSSPPAPVPLEIAAAVIAEVAASEMPPARVIRIVPKPPKVAAKPRGKGKKANPTGTFDFGE